MLYVKKLTEWDIIKCVFMPTIIQQNVHNILKGFAIVFLIMKFYNSLKYSVKPTRVILTSLLLPSLPMIGLKGVRTARKVIYAASFISWKNCFPKFGAWILFIINVVARQGSQAKWQNFFCMISWGAAMWTVPIRFPEMLRSSSNSVNHHTWSL